MTIRLTAAALFLLAAVLHAEPASQPVIDRANLVDKWTAEYTVAGKVRTITHTFHDNGTFDEDDSNWGTGKGTWELKGDTLHFVWDRRGFQGRRKVIEVTDDTLVVADIMGDKRTYKRVKN